MKRMDKKKNEIIISRAEYKRVIRPAHKYDLMCEFNGIQ